MGLLSRPKMAKTKMLGNFGPWAPGPRAVAQRGSATAQFTLVMHTQQKHAAENVTHSKVNTVLRQHRIAINSNHGRNIATVGG